MTNAISNVTQTQANVQPTPTRQTSAQSTPQAVQASVDTVHISAAAQALQEALETSAQTAKEANAGDVQAQHLLAREAAEKAKR